MAETKKIAITVEVNVSDEIVQTSQESGHPFVMKHSTMEAIQEYFEGAIETREATGDDLVLDVAILASASSDEPSPEVSEEAIAEENTEAMGAVSEDSEGQDELLESIEEPGEEQQEEKESADLSLGQDELNAALGLPAEENKASSEEPESEPEINEEISELDNELLGSASGEKVEDSQESAIEETDEIALETSAEEDAKESNGDAMVGSLDQNELESALDEMPEIDPTAPFGENVDAHISDPVAEQTSSKEPEPASTQTKVEKSEVAVISSNQEALECLSRDHATRLKAIPISLSEGILKVAVINSEDHVLLNKLRLHTGKDIQMEVYSEASIESALNKEYGNVSDAQERDAVLDAFSF